MYAKKGIQAYRKDSLKSDLASADPHRIIQLLMQGVLERLALGKGYIERRDMEAKAVTLTRVVEIINALRDALDRDANPELVDNLDSLYSFMIEQVNEASAQQDSSKLEVVMRLMLEIKGAWDQISDVAKQEAAQAHA